MSFNHHFFTELANWDGSLSQPPSDDPSSSSTSSSSAHAVSVNATQYVDEQQRLLIEEELRRQSVSAMPPPPLPYTPVRGEGSRWTATTPNHESARRNSWSAMSISSDSSFSNNDEERRRVEGMLLAADDLMVSSPPKLEHHWQVPAAVLTPDITGNSNPWPATTSKSLSDSMTWLHTLPAALLEEHRQFPYMDILASMPPPVGPTLSPSSQRSSSSPHRKSSDELADEESSRSIPPALSFSPSHYSIPELPALLDGDTTLDPQAKDQDSTTPTPILEHKSSSNRPEFDPVEPPTPTSLFDSLDDGLNTSSRHLSPEVPVVFPPPVHRVSDDGKPNSSGSCKPSEAHQDPHDQPLIKNNENSSKVQQPGSLNTLPVVNSLPTVPQREPSIVPETPQAISPASPDYPATSESHIAEDATIRSGSPMRISPSNSPVNRNDMGDPSGTRSTAESTLVGHAPPKVIVPHPIPDEEEKADQQVDSSPLSSPPVSLRSLRSSMSMFVDVPPLPARYSRDQARPVSAYFPELVEDVGDGESSRPVESQKVGPPQKRKEKRKHSEAVVESSSRLPSPSLSSSRSPRPKKPRRASPVPSSSGEIGLESLGPEARDVLAPFCEYFEVEVDCDADPERVVVGRVSDEAQLERMLGLMLRRLFGPSGHSQTQKEKAAPVPPTPPADTSTAVATPKKTSKVRSPTVTPLKSPSRRRLLNPPSTSKAGPSSEGTNKGVQYQPSEPTADSHSQAFAIHPELKAFPSPPQDNLEQLTAVRDRNAFLGVQDDPYDGGSFMREHEAGRDPMHIDVYGQAPSSSSQQHFGELPNTTTTTTTTTTTLYATPSYVTPNFGHEGAVFYSADGTIDPTLIAPPAHLINQFRTPSLSRSPSPVPSTSSPELPLRQSLSQDTSVDIVGHVQSSSVEESEDTSDDEFTPCQTKGKGKERASDVGIRAREGEGEGELVERESLSQRVIGRRDRRPTAKAVEAREWEDPSSVRGLSVPGADLHDKSSSKAARKSIVNPAKPKKVPKPKIGPNFEGGFCHQCRRSNNHAKMQCCGMRVSDGKPCLLLFCESCVIKRYPPSRLVFSLGRSDFVCPKCEDFCNCTSCARKRGEVYVSTAHVRTGLEAKVRRKAKRRPKRDEYDDDDDDDDDDAGYTDGEDGYSDVHVPVPATLPVGQTFGAVYDLTGRKQIGVGIVADGPSQKVVLVPNATKTSVGKRQFIGRPRPGWHAPAVEDTAERPVGRAYVGKRGPLFSAAAYKSFDALMSAERPLTPPSLDADEGDETNVNAGSPSKLLDAAQLSFTLADLLGTLSQPQDGVHGLVPSVPP